LHDAGFIVEILKEVTVDKPSDADPAEQRWSPIPLFLDLRARRR
jgi:hypothetical protein